MRVCTVLFLVFGFVSSGYAQGERALNSLRLEADKFYEEEQYNLAAQ
jgi:hypothetical protein